MTQKVKRSGVLPANPCRTLKNLGVHGTNAGIHKKAHDSSKNRNIAYSRLREWEVMSLEKTEREKNGEHDEENETVETGV